MRITRPKAHHVARAMVAKKDEEIGKLGSAYSALVTDLYLKTIPKDVISVMRKYPSYIAREAYITIYSPAGVRLDSTSTSERIPTNTNGDAKLKLKKGDVKKFTAAWQAYEKARLSQRQLQGEIAQTLLKLYTFGRVKKEFPEAVPFFNIKEEEEKPLPALATLRKKIK